MSEELKLFKLWGSMQLIESMTDFMYMMGGEHRKIPDYVYQVMNARRYSDDMKLALLFREATGFKKLGSPFSAMKIYFEILRYRLIPKVVSEFYKTMYTYYHHRGAGTYSDNVFTALCQDLDVLQEPELYHCKAQILVNKGEHDDAINTLHSALKKQPKNQITSRMLASLHSGLGQDEEALIVLDNYLKKEKRDSVVLSQKGMILFGSGKFKNARKCFEKAVNSDKNNAEFQLLFAAAEARLGEMEKAKDLIGKVMLLQKRGGQPWREIGVFYSNLSILDLAEYCFEKAVYLSPKEPEYARDLALVYRNSGQNKKAISFLKSKLKFYGKSDRVLRMLADVCLMEGELDEAEKYTLEAIDVLPKDAPLHIMQGDILLRKDDSTGSEAAFNKALELSPNKPETYVRIGSVYLNSWKIDRAEEMFKAALEMIPNYPGAKSGMKIVKKLSTKKVSVRKVYEQTREQLEALMSGDLPPSKDGHKIRVNIWDALVDEEEPSE
ncbi:MAG: tetratricopeptide repeat protein [Candidatus Thorarchaeota archaeon]|nr:tetratricopeptide repeat protein [Candidatus Thorarchaeota archaeon]